jgi:Zn-dependent oligopeptidase
MNEFRVALASSSSDTLHSMFGIQIKQVHIVRGWSTGVAVTEVVVMQDTRCIIVPYLRVEESFSCCLAN